jgi:hypothetical protein
MTSNPRRFDKYIPLFSNKDDLRVRLFLHELQDNADEIIGARSNNMYVNTDLKFKDPIRANMKKRFFRNGSTARDADELDDEWLLFFIKLISTQAEKTLNLRDDEDALKIVRGLSGVINTRSKNKSIDQLVAVFLRYATNIYKTALAAPNAAIPNLVAADEITTTDDWSQANYVKFKGVNDIRTLLFPAGFWAVGRTSMGLVNNSLARITQYKVAMLAVDTAKTAAVAAAARAGGAAAGPLTINNADSNTFVAEKTALIALIANVNSSLPDATYSTVINNWWNTKFAPVGGAAAGAAGSTNTPQHHLWSVVDEFRTIVKGVLLFNDKRFDFNINRLLARELAKRKEEQQAPAKPDPFFYPITTLVSSSGTEYFQDDQFRLWRGNGPNDPNKIAVHFESKEYEDLKEDKKCMSTGVYKNNTTKCRDYLMDCLSGNDVSKCREYLIDPNFADDAKDEVKNMNPELMYLTLHAFQFRFITSTNKVEDFDSWLSSLKEAAAPLNLSPSDISSIGTNVQLKSYLTMIVNKVNDNPDILRSKRNILNKTSTQTPTKSPISFLTRRNVKNPSAALALAASLPTPYPMPPVRAGLIMGFGQFGGGVETFRYLEQRKDETKRLASTYRNMLTDVVSRLSKLNKTLDDGTTAGIIDHITNLDKYEHKTIEALAIYEKYLELHEFYGQDDKTNKVDVQTAQAFADKHASYFNKVTKKRYTIQHLIEALENAAQNAANTANTAQPAKTNSGPFQALP